ncbi:hypothetical protein C2E23DRAFT_210556 [Lenzites betulinus]|nr:hypothetical protein C2E23DRAFT_210556 [Lenzites betulinus]
MGELLVLYALAMVTRVLSTGVNYRYHPRGVQLHGFHTDTLHVWILDGEACQGGAERLRPRWSTRDTMIWVHSLRTALIANPITKLTYNGASRDGPEFSVVIIPGRTIP